MQKISFVILLIFLSVSCDEENFVRRDYPFIKTLPITNVESNGSITLNAEILHLGSTDILDHGFTWGRDLRSESFFESVGSLGSTSASGAFSLDITSGLIAEERYFIRAYIVNEEKTVFGKIVEFETVRNSPTISISDFTPKSGTWGDVISISGENFDPFKSSNNIITIGNATAEVVNVTSELIEAKIPNELNSVSSNITISTGGQTVTSEESFSLNAPQIITVNPSPANIGQAVTIEGANFHPTIPQLHQIMVGTVNASVVSSGESQISFIAPTLAGGDYPLSVTILGQSATFDNLTVVGPGAGEFLPTTGMIGTEVIISGTNFSDDISKIEVLFGTVNATISENSSTDIKVNVPQLSSGDYSITVISDGITIPYSNTFEVTPSPIPDDYIAYYPFNGNTNDESTSGFNGSILGSPTLDFDRKGNSNSAYTFDSSSDVIETSNEMDENFQNGLSFSTWINASNIGAEPKSILSNYNGNGLAGDCNGRIGFQLRLNTDGRVRILYHVDSDNSKGVTTTSSIPIGSWNHILVTWTGDLTANSQSSFNIYLDGILASVTNSDVGSFCTQSLVESPDPFRIGRQECAAGPCHSFEGIIDDIRIYPRPLSADEVNSLFTE